MLTGVHFLLTYMCSQECDHCFVYSGPRAKGTFTVEQMRAVMDELPRIGTVQSVYFEGGEAFLFYPLLLEGVRLAREQGFEAGIVTNAYWATCQADAELWLGPLGDLGLANLSVSDDALHHGEEDAVRVNHARAAAEKLGIPVSGLCTESPCVGQDEQGEPSVTGGVIFRGRAAEKLTDGLPTRACERFTQCSDEDLRDPRRVHVDAYGHVHLCQGLSMGNMWETPLSELVRHYDPDSHPICGPLLRGGPARLAAEYGVEHDARYISECHFCYAVRRTLVDRFSQYLAPGQVYGFP
jgi:radical SAM family protein